MNINEEFAKQVKQTQHNMLEISLLDVDTIIANYMEETVIPVLEQNGKQVKVPLVYGNAERWKTAQTDGYLKDKEGRIQLPIIMFKRNSIARNDQIRYLKEEQLTYPTVKKYSKNNSYDRFSALNPSLTKLGESYDVRMPDYVNLTYEVMIWTGYTEHSNKITEQFQYATEQYWGDDRGYKFKVLVDSFDNQQEIGAGSERIIRTSFNMIVYAYILPKRTENKPMTQKGITISKVVITSETIVDANELSNLTTGN